jgi:hypothetical protein
LTSNKDREAIRKIATPEIMEIKNPFQDAMTASRSEEQKLQELEYKEKLAAYHAEVEAVEREKRNIEISRYQDALHARGWKRTPRPFEVYFEEGTCNYCGSKNVAYIAANSPNYTDQWYDKSIPLEKSSKDQYGNWYLRHNCFANAKGDKKINTLVKRLENTESIIKDLRNQLDAHKQDQSKHRSFF